eukprot:1170142-Prorocentrum_minimum.AAC.2
MVGVSGCAPGAPARLQHHRGGVQPLLLTAHKVELHRVVLHRRSLRLVLAGAPPRPPASGDALSARRQQRGAPPPLHLVLAGAAPRPPSEAEDAASSTTCAPLRRARALSEGVLGYLQVTCEGGDFTCEGGDFTCEG